MDAGALSRLKESHTGLPARLIFLGAITSCATYEYVRPVRPRCQERKRETRRTRMQFIVRTMNGYCPLPRLIQSTPPLRGKKGVLHSGRRRFAQLCERRDLLRPIVAEREHQDLLLDLVVAFEVLSSSRRRRVPARDRLRESADRRRERRNLARSVRWTRIANSARRVHAPARSRRQCSISRFHGETS